MQEISSRKNPLVRHLKKLGTERAYREACGEFLCDGLKLYQEARRWGAEIRLLATSRPEIGADFPGQSILLPEDLLASISPSKSPQNLLFACKKPDWEAVNKPEYALILDGVQDPGNVGSLVRSAAAFSVDQVILTGGSADLYNPKTVRGAMGALFYQRVRAMSLGQLIQYLKESELPLWGAALAEEGKALGGPLPTRGAIAIGSEGRGLSRALLEHCHELIKIPMNPACESLNAGVAGSILLWEVYKNRYLQNSAGNV